MNIRKNETTCLITGAASGIGRAAALALARRGVRLFLTDINLAGLEETAAMVRDRGGVVGAAGALDITRYDQVRAFSDEILAQCGAVDIVMNIAGIAVWGLPDRLSIDHWRKVIEANLMGPINVIQCLVPAMMASGKGGHLVNVSSAAGLLALPLHAPYSASKFGLRGLSEVLRYDLKRYGIGVSVICPGAVETPLKGTVEIAGIDMRHEKVIEMKKRFSRRAVTPERVAEVILRAVERNSYLGFTSADIRFLYWCKRKLYPLYHLAMLLLGRMASGIMRQAGTKNVTP